MKFSITEENYLKAIYHLQLENDTVATNAVAHHLHTRAASVTDMMKKLSAKKLLHYKPYYGFYLTTKGKQIAINIIRRHRLWELFLAQKLGFKWDEVHVLAEELEHVSSNELIDRLDKFLLFPQFDPHGDPIPDQKGRIKHGNKILLNDVAPDLPVRVVRVSNQSTEMLDLLHHKNINIGTLLQLKKRLPFDRSMELKSTSSKTITISEQVAKNIFVTYEKDGKL
ncbi:MAG: metal-dependent transcriptional regulator [Chitinophagaceae bacterium]